MKARRLGVVDSSRWIFAPLVLALPLIFAACSTVTAPPKGGGDASQGAGPLGEGPDAGYTLPDECKETPWEEIDCAGEGNACQVYLCEQALPKFTAACPPGEKVEPANICTCMAYQALTCCAYLAIQECPEDEEQAKTLLAGCSKDLDAAQKSCEAANQAQEGEGTEGEGEGSEGEGVEGEGAFACQADTDCGTGRCLAGQCVECVADVDCGGGGACQNNKCEGGYTPVACQTDRDCPVENTPYCNTQLQGGVCVACITDAHCPAGQVCSPEGFCGEPPAISCVKNTDCPLENICLDSQCAKGCNRDEDCLPGKFCDRTQGVHGLCVQCLVESDCATGEKCINGACTVACSANGDCREGQVCDPGAGRCVACLTKEDCGQGYLCVNQACSPGCQSDGDCPANKKCENGQCGGGCSSDAECAANEGCDAAAGVCRPRCTESKNCWGYVPCPQSGVCLDGQPCQSSYSCGANDVCDGASRLCVDCAVVPNSIPGLGDEVKGCDRGEQCVDNTCVGCSSNNDCPGDQVCDVASQLCVECSANGDCSGDTPVCDTAAFRCVQCVAPADCGGGACVDNECVQCEQDGDCPSGHCLDSQCVACLNDADCGASQKCDRATHTCYSGTLKGLCETCGTTADCIPGHECIEDIHNGIGEKYCANPCQGGMPWDRPCPNGFGCIDSFCKPAFGKDRAQVVGTVDLEPVSSCATIRDTKAGTSCQQSATDCGARIPSADDASCLLGGWGGVCTYKCADQWGMSIVGCPEGFACQEVQPNVSACVKP